MKEKDYLSPEIEVLGVSVEKGYAGSSSGNGDDGMSTPTVGGF